MTTFLMLFDGRDARGFREDRSTVIRLLQKNTHAKEVAYIDDPFHNGDLGPLDWFMGWAFGLNVEWTISEALEKLWKGLRAIDADPHLRAEDIQIEIAGYGTGATLALHFTNLLYSMINEPKLKLEAEKEYQRTRRQSDVSLAKGNMFLYNVLGPSLFDRLKIGKTTLIEMEPVTVVPLYYKVFGSIVKYSGLDLTPPKTPVTHILGFDERRDQYLKYVHLGQNLFNTTKEVWVKGTHEQLGYKSPDSMDYFIRTLATHVRLKPGLFANGSRGMYATGEGYQERDLGLLPILTEELVNSEYKRRPLTFSYNMDNSPPMVNTEALSSTGESQQATPRKQV